MIVILKVLFLFLLCASMWGYLSQRKEYFVYKTKAKRYKIYCVTFIFGGIDVGTKEIGSYSEESLALEEYNKLREKL